MSGSNYSFNLNPDYMSAFRTPSLMGTDSSTPSLAGIGYDPTSLASIQSFGLPSFGSVPQESSLMDTLFGKNGKMGAVNTGLDVGKGLFGMWAGIKGMSMAKEQFNFNKENILRDRGIKEGMLARTVALQDQNRAAARGYASTNQSIPSIPSIADQMKRYGA
jgi:hypothetical protein